MKILIACILHHMYSFQYYHGALSLEIVNQHSLQFYKKGTSYILAKNQAYQPELITNEIQRTAFNLLMLTITKFKQ